jgi:hypothetical protein
MRKDIHLAALRAGARVAFSTALLAGCSAGPETGTSDPATDNLTGKSDAGACVPGAKFSCTDLIEAAFPGTDDPSPGTKQTVAHAVQACCAEELAAKRGFIEHRWACCANLDPSDSTHVGAACTPWGPPVPPAMRRRDAEARAPHPMGMA